MGSKKPTSPPNYLVERSPRPVSPPPPPVPAHKVTGSISITIGKIVINGQTVAENVKIEKEIG